MKCSNFDRVDRGVIGSAVGLIPGSVLGHIIYKATAASGSIAGSDPAKYVKYLLLSSIPFAIAGCIIAARKPNCE